MANSNDILWFKTSFAANITAATAGTVFDVDMLTALACQETGELWTAMRRQNLTPVQIAALCCGDIIDANGGRNAFPRTKADLTAVPNGTQMFAIARTAFVDMAAHVPQYQRYTSNPNKFCHGFGVFQYDLQFFLEDPNYFLLQKYQNFSSSLQKALGELKTGLRKRGLQNRTSITDMEFCEVAICYNTGGFDPSRGLKQGYKVDGKYYGEFIRDYLAMARRVAAPGAAPAVVAPAAGTAFVSDGGAVTAAGAFFEVTTSVSTLRLRSEPRISNPEGENVVAEMPDGHIVQAVGGDVRNGFIEVETMLGNRLFRGFAASRYLQAISAPSAQVEISNSAPPAAVGQIPPANLKPPAGLITKRTAIATAHSLNEPNMPRRTSTGPAELRAELGAIIDYLATDNPRHKRYWPRDGLTFCNIYAHDYCTLAGVYLPRTWWNQSALLKIAAGQQLQAKLGNTVDEVRANDLFRWLRDFGTAFGWRRAASPTELQDHANMGGVSLIVARRKQDGRSGHIVAVVPETADETAKRDASGQVTMPLQSQAGAENFRYGRSTLNWWKDDRFAESAFWIHG
ncbi:SH3 domain-containing protein [Rhizobium terrae]|uniref:hypothetical protein n=1 Tax=Rhizobium terrae TaxID=2171756 RepID=UPI000E3D1F2D|nr:hypothetical protein [Rhizobium terrae]